MERFGALGRVAGPVTLHSGSTSYFSTPENELDPMLFTHTTLKGWVRNGILHMLFGFLNEQYRHADLWCHVWIAGSAVSYQWSAHREPGDMDVLIGVDYIAFRRAHPEYAGLNDVEISKMLNEDFREYLQPSTEDWHGFEVTFYVNPGATDIRSINPYAAYDLTHNEWTVFPSKTGPVDNPEWEEKAKKDWKMSSDIVSRYSSALTELHAAQNDASRRNAEYKLQQSIEQGSMLFEDIHKNRRLAFSQGGQGYYDYNNYRWQAGKRSGVVPAMRQMYDYLRAAKQQDELETYGVELPDTETLIRRAATYRKVKD